MQNRRSFLKAGIAGSVFLPTFADLSSKAEEKSVAAKPREINIGIVGFGGWGHVMANVITMSCKGVRVRCVCDIWKYQMQRARSFFKSWHQEVNGYLDFREMLDAEAKNIEAVIVTTPDWVHCEQVCECLRRGLHVYCASPMADTLEKSAEMCRAVKKANFRRRDIRYA